MNLTGISNLVNEMEKEYLKMQSAQDFTSILRGILIQDYTTTEIEVANDQQ